MEAADEREALHVERLRIDEPCADVHVHDLAQQELAPAIPEGYYGVAATLERHRCRGDARRRNLNRRRCHETGLVELVGP